MDCREYVENFMESVSYIQTSKNMDSISRFSKGETKLLATLYFSGGRVQAKELARVSGMSTPRVTAILNAEEEKGYIRREAIDGDRRKVNVILTQEGELEYRNRRREFQNRLTSYFEFLGEDDTKHLVRIMERTKEFVEIKRRENQEA